jgi:hypothetical protein
LIALTHAQISWVRSLGSRLLWERQIRHRLFRLGLGLLGRRLGPLGRGLFKRGERPDVVRRSWGLDLDPRLG